MRTRPPDPPRRVTTALPGPRAAQLIQRGSFDLQSPYRAVVFDDLASAGCSLVDVDGNVFLDLFSSFALGALGYNHPAMVAVGRSPEFVAAACNPSSTPFVTSPSWITFMEALQQRFAPPGARHAYCVDAGGEGVESAIKAAFIVHGERRRRAAGRPASPLELPPDEGKAWMENRGTDAVIVSFDGAFHGRGLGPMSATHSKLMHKADLPAFPWPVVPFPANRWPLERYADENAAAEAASLRALADVLDAYAGRVAAVLVEPVQSEGGDRHASAAFFREVQRLAAQAGAALILDEVQTGTGISGRLWCHTWFDLPTPPNFVTFGKKMQLGGYFCDEAHTVQQFGRMYQTRNGDRARGLLALATLETIEADGLLENVRTTGALFLDELSALERSFPTLISQARGRGFLLAFDLPDAGLRDRFNRRCLELGLFASYTGVRSVRLRPHLITGPAEVAEAMGVFRRVCSEMVA